MNIKPVIFLGILIKYIFLLTIVVKISQGKEQTVGLIDKGKQKVMVWKQVWNILIDYSSKKSNRKINALIHFIRMY